MKRSNLVLLSGAIFCVVANSVFASERDSRSTKPDNFSVIGGSVVSGAEQVDVNMEEYIQDNHPLYNADNAYEEIKNRLEDVLDPNRASTMELNTSDTVDLITAGSIESIALQILCELAHDFIEHQDIYSESDYALQNNLARALEETKYWEGLLYYINSTIAVNYIDAFNDDGEEFTDELNDKLEQASIHACNLWFEYQIEEKLERDFPDDNIDTEDDNEETKVPKQPKSLKADKKAKKPAK